ncbi:BatD family protein, partial [Paracoccus nototheniae]|uniref:BatD family protein n=2 Tax=Paracoccus nototheniae TaxID=2489002 RepID=UPI00103C90D7
MVIRLILMLLALALAGPLRAETPAPLAPGEARLLILHDHGNPVVAEMVRLTLRGEYDLTVSLESLTFPNSDDYDWMQIDRDRWFQERIGGRMIQIFERDIALFPRQPGDLTIGPLVHDLTNITRSGVREPVSVTSGTTRLAVKSFPADSRPLTARRLVLTDELSAPPGRLEQEDILTRRVTIEALGAMAHHLPPRPDITQPWLISFTLPETRETIPTPGGPVARVVWEWQMRPRTGEPGVLPAIPFAWFDTDSRRVEVVAMKPIPFGFAGFTTASGAGSGTGPALRWQMAGLALLGGAIALVVLLRGRLPALGRGMRALRPGPHAAAMRRAAAAGDLIALRAAAAAHLAWRRNG